MKRMVLLVGLILVVSTAFAYGEQVGNPQNLNVRSNEVRADKIKAFVDGFETYAKKIIDDYKKEVEGIETKDKAEKYRKLMECLGQYFRNANFSLREWLLIQEEFDKRYEVTKSDYDNLGIEGAYGTVRHYLEKSLPQSLSTTLLDIISDKTYRDGVRLKYIYYLELTIGSIYNKKGAIEDKDKLKILAVLVKIVEDKTNAIDLRAEAAFSVADYFGKNETAVKTILGILSDPQENEKVKSRALFGTSRWGVADDVRIKEKMLDIIKNRDAYSPEVFNKSLRVVAGTQDKETSKVLIDILQNTNDEKLFKEVRNSLQSYDDKDVIKVVLKNYNRFGKEDLSFLWKEDVLIEIMNEGSTEYSLLAIKALSENTPRDPNNPASGLKTLEQQLYHQDPKIRIASIDAIRKFAKRGNDEVRKKSLEILKTAERNEKNKEVMKKFADSIKSLEK